jgi:hypothetical protein
MRRIFGVVSLLLVAFIVAAFWHGLPSVTINNYQSATTTYYNQITHHDINGNALDVHAGNFIQVGSTFYFYGESHQCGYHPGTVGPWCGVTVYSTPDFNHWKFEGYLFDGTATIWQTRCGTTTNSFVGCYSPKMLYNAANNNYVLWLYGQGAGNVATEYVFTCTTPTGGATPSTPGTGCTQQTSPTLPVPDLAAPSFYVDGSGNGWMAYDDLGAGYLVSVIALNSAFTATTGSPTSTGQNGEGLFIFERGGLTYVGFGATGCAYCTTASIIYVSASSPLGTYSSSTTLNSSCQGQPRDAGTVTSDGVTTQVFMFDQWWDQGNSGGGSGNQGFAGIYFQPLQFSGNNIAPFTCQQKVTIQGVARAADGNAPGVPPATDQTDVADAFRDWCDISNSVFRLQTFIPTASTVNSVSLPLGENDIPCGVASTGCVPPNGSLTVSLVTLDGSNNPVSTLASQTITAASLLWSTKWTNVSFSHAVTPGTSYGIELSGANSVGCYGTSFNQAGSQPYANGVERVSTNGGSSWSTESGRSIMFSTY